MASSEIPHLLTASGEQLTDGITNEPMIPDGRKGFYTVVRMETSNASLTVELIPGEVIQMSGVLSSKDFECKP